MKFKVDVECTPEEARAFLGLPDVSSVQRSILADVEERLKGALDLMDPEAVMRAWMPAVKGWEDLMRSMMGKVGSARSDADD